MSFLSSLADIVGSTTNAARNAAAAGAFQTPWTCQDCGIKGVGGTDDPDQCSDASGKWNLYWGCCNCALDKHGWSKYEDDACLQCRDRRAAGVRASPPSASGQVAGLLHAGASTLSNASLFVVHGTSAGVKVGMATGAASALLSVRNPFTNAPGHLFFKTNANTQLFMRLVQLVFAGGNPPASSAQVSNKLLSKQLFRDKIYKAPFGGLKFIMVDEDIQSGFVENLLAMLALTAAENFAFEETEATERLMYWPHEAAAVSEIDFAFGKYLPANPRDSQDLASDQGISALFTLGAGCVYLQAVSASSHATPPHAIMEANLEYLSRYETRSSWLRYGASAYFGAAKGKGTGAAGEGLPELVGIWVCHSRELLLPGDSAWGHAKAVVRAALCCSLTLRDHLSHVHWVSANGLSMAARTQLGSQHLLRRLLKQFYYGTAEINAASKTTLLPVNGFAHRIFALSAAAWPQYFTDVLAAWRWRPFPDTLAARGLPPEFLARWPYAVDGLRLWGCMERYVSGMLDITYPDEETLGADEEVADFWASFETQFQTPWGLPALTRKSLVALVTDLIFQVTAQHELVGSIGEYLGTPQGLLTKLAPGASEGDVQSTCQALILISLTGIHKPPLQGDWSHIFHGMEGVWGAQRHERVLGCVKLFQADLTACAEAIDDANLDRVREMGLPFVAFHPRNLLTSVSI